MSLAELIEISKIVKPKSSQLSTLLLGVFEDLLCQIVKLCDNASVDLKEIGALSTMEASEWQTSLLQVFRSIFTQDCKKFQSSGGQQDQLPIPGISQPLNHFLEFLATRGNEPLMQ
jgi:hypothetical protein